MSQEIEGETRVPGFQTAFTYRLKLTAYGDEVAGIVAVDLVATLAPHQTLDTRRFVGLVRGQVLPLRFTHRFINSWSTKEKTT